MNLYCTVEFRACLDLFSTSIGLRTCSSLTCNASVQFQKKIRKISRRHSRSPKYPVVVLQRTAKKCTKNYNTRAQLLFCSLNFLFCGVLVAVAVVVCLRSLLADFYHHVCMYSIVEGESRGTGIWDCRGRMKKKEKEGSSKFPSKRTDKFKNIV